MSIYSIIEGLETVEKRTDERADIAGQRDEITTKYVACPGKKNSITTPDFFTLCSYLTGVVLYTKLHNDPAILRTLLRVCLGTRRLLP